MRQRMEMSVVLVAMIVVALMSVTVTAQVSLEDQLKAQYTTAKVGSDSSGYSVIQEGTLLKVQKGGIIGVPYKNVATRTATYKDGVVHATDLTGGATSKIASMGCGLLHKCPSTPDALQGEKTTKLFKVGDKVYVEKLAVNLPKDNVTFSIVACDTCNNTDPPTYNKAQVVFQFASGSLANIGASKVEDTIAELLAIDDSNNGDQGNNNNGNGNGNGGGNDQGGNNNGGGQQQQADPVQITVGMTPDQVKAANGNPDKIISLGAKQIFVYKDMKITFMNGKVSDVQ